ncbi:uncharacterized protein LOC136039509 [Artemia franciscana]|uniref:Uncharacterized protein n=1 Tax=Artemia franciscana TaxID=6661 RepID=A0AA88L578_ARTSF|nr:hypothetical protein QYM36_007416 [Artemia franciscana]
METPTKGRLDDPTQQCGSCHQLMGDDLAPHVLECKHRVCLKCVRELEDKGTRSIYCSYCWHQSEINDPLLSNSSTNPSSPFGHNLVDLCNSLNTLSVAFGGDFGPISKNGAGSPVLSDSNSTSSDSSTGAANGLSKSKTECPIHHSPQTMFCVTCSYAICYLCACNSHNPSNGHSVRPNQEMTEHTISELHNEISSLRKLSTETKAMQVKQREFTLKVLEACATLEKQMIDRLALQDESFTSERQDSTQYLINKTLFQLPTINGNEEANDLLMSLKKEKIRLQNHHHELSVQCSLEEMVSSSATVFDFPTFKQNLHALRHRRNNLISNHHHSFSDPISFLANYCSSRVYSKHLFNAAVGVTSDSIHSSQNYTGNPMAQAGRLINTSPYPRYFMDVEVNGVMEGRVVFEVRPDVAPKMSKNFGALCSGEKGYGYKGCQVFQCWGGESCIAGDFECNSGRGGRSSFDEPFFLPDDSKLPCVRGTIGMRRTQKRHNNLGLVGSQFRIILREMPFFTGVFGKVVIGIEVIEKISFLGDQQGFPRQVITVANCGVFA